jgi:hypothetical protein
LDDGEIDPNLIAPAGMNGGVYKKGIGPAGADAFNCLLTAMSRAVIHDPKDALGRSVGFAAHDLSEEAVGRGNAAFLFAVSEKLSMMHASRFSADEKGCKERLHDPIALRSSRRTMTRLDKAEKCQCVSDMENGTPRRHKGYGAAASNNRVNPASAPCSCNRPLGYQFG